MSESVLTVLTSMLTSGLYGLFAGFLAGLLLRRQRMEEKLAVIASTDAVITKNQWADNKPMQSIVFALGVLLFYFGLRSNSTSFFPLTGGFGMFLMFFVGTYYWKRYGGLYPNHGGF
jgi:hypothetical protein